MLPNRQIPRVIHFHLQKYASLWLAAGTGTLGYVSYHRSPALHCLPAASSSSPPPSSSFPSAFFPSFAPQTDFRYENLGHTSGDPLEDDGRRRTPKGSFLSLLMDGAVAVYHGLQYLFKHTAYGLSYLIPVETLGKMDRVEMVRCLTAVGVGFLVGCHVNRLMGEHTLFIAGSLMLVVVRFMMDWGWLEIHWDRIEQWRLKWIPWLKLDQIQRFCLELPYAHWALGGFLFGFKYGHWFFIF